MSRRQVGVRMPCSLMRVPMVRWVASPAQKRSMGRERRSTSFEVLSWLPVMKNCMRFSTVKASCLPMMRSLMREEVT